MDSGSALQERASRNDELLQVSRNAAHRLRGQQLQATEAPPNPSARCGCCADSCHSGAPHSGEPGIQSELLLFSGWVAPNLLGEAAVAMQANAVGAIAELQVVGLRRSGGALAA
ncbi:MAG: hypothetical protein QOD09_599 [Bradyrhizobium sp.]|jgi:hypothetical protein|nr:hypothetical protein [Bradyrhizobium sp.]